jgi:N-acetyl-alpha-D-glucosaminyl L-malate synthase BshA
LARQILQRRGRPAPPLVTSLHGTDVTLFGGEPALGAVVRHAVLESDLLTTPSEWLRRAAHERLGLSSETRVLVVPNFVDPEEFRPLVREAVGGPDLEAAFPAYDWSGEGRPRVLLHASNFRPLKRVGDAVVALSEILRQRPCVLLLAGDGPERDGVERLARVLDVEDHVLFLGEQARLGPVMARADLFLLPSETESFGLAALEALACGVPVVASEVGGLPEVVRHGETGLLVPRHDPRAMAAAALALLGDEPRRSAMGRAARADVLARFRPEPVLQRYEQLYRELLER